MGAWLSLHLTWSRLILVLALVASTSLGAQTTDVVYQIKASYIYNFLQFVHFPQEALQDRKSVV